MRQTREKATDGRQSTPGSRITLTARDLPGATRSVVVHLACALPGAVAVEATWDLATFPEAAADEEEAGRRVARLVLAMRRLGCECPLDLLGLKHVREAVARARR